MSIINEPVEKRAELGMLKVPPKYITGEYNNQYIDLMSDEMKIYQEKIKRTDPLVTKSLPEVIKVREKDAKLKSKLKKATKKKRYEDITIFEFLTNVFMDIKLKEQKFIDLNFFSQYIPEIGFRFSIDLVYN